MKIFSISPIKITLLYVFISVFWIYFSDQCIRELGPDGVTTAYFQTLKGWLFVLVTAVLLYFLMSRMLKALKESEQKLRLVLENLEHRIDERTQELVCSQKQLRRLVLEQTQMELKERRRMADVLHDNIQQMLAASILRLNHIRERIWCHDSKIQIAEVSTLLDGVIGTTRLLSNELRPPVLQETGFASSLRWLADDLKKRHGVKVGLELDESTEELPESLCVLLFRLVRELLCNVVQHAQTNRARLTLTRIDPEWVRLRVSDDGVGFCVSTWEGSLEEGQRYGLFGLREIIHSLGGTIDIHSEPGKGCQVELYIPLKSLTTAQRDKEKSEEQERLQPIPNRGVFVYRSLKSTNYPF